MGRGRGRLGFDLMMGGWMWMRGWTRDGLVVVAGGYGWERLVMSGFVVGGWRGCDCG